jgi:hypothetical protein
MMTQHGDTKKTENKEKKNDGFQKIGSLFDAYQLEDKGGYVTREFQDFGYRLATELDDLAHKSLYIKMAKEESRALLEAARAFVIDSKARSKGKLFMWKVRELKNRK